MKLPSQTTNDDRRWMYELNLNAPIDLAQQALPGMQTRGTGWILNISSETARQPAVPYRDSKYAAHIITAYGATKAALDRYTKALAHEVAEHDIFVNAMAPVAIVLTQGADYVRDIARKNPDMVGARRDDGRSGTRALHGATRRPAWSRAATSSTAWVARS